MHRLRPAFIPWPRPIAMVLLALATLVVSITAGKQEDAAAPRYNNNVAAVEPSTPTMNVSAISLSTPYPTACETALSSPASRSTTTKDPFAASVQFAMARATSARTLARNLSTVVSSSSSGMEDCAELLDISLGQLGDALAGAAADVDGVTTWLSAALTNQATCIDSLAAGEPDRARRDAVRTKVAELTQFIATALALHVNKLKANRSGDAGKQSAGAVTPTTSTTTMFPSWVSQHDKKLLESSMGGTSGDVAIDAVVAVDGSGTLGLSTRRSQRWWRRTAVEEEEEGGRLGAAMGSGFIAKGLIIINSAGPRKGQAVALRVGGDLSVVYQCAIQAYQDTLYVHSNRQFYGEDDIAGTVDFIFGNSAVVIQNCDIQARRPSPG
ncbi:hypothetical protein HU200_029364 [Digitaria exilis]|uniref:Pectinesterase n=1 Tax=Digitaria exilis TaxID=1010633 RepID=A0A835BZ35_9POAL|nr:hypothetical protein HU200_029364 [Digitaria exilis]